MVSADVWWSTPSEIVDPSTCISGDAVEISKDGVYISISVVDCAEDSNFAIIAVADAI